jgi:hypothetical protein
MSICPELPGKMFPSNSGIVPMTWDAFPTKLAAEAAPEMAFERGTRRWLASKATETTTRAV